MTALGDAIHEHLVEAGLTQSDLARRLGVTSSAVNGWARGKTPPSRENLERIEDELSVEPRGALMRLAGYAAPDDAPPTVESLLRADPGLDPEDKRVLLRIIRMARERYAQAG